MKKLVIKSLRIIKSEGFSFFFRKVKEKIIGRKVFASTLSAANSIPKNNDLCEVDFEIFNQYFNSALKIDEVNHVKFEVKQPIDSEISLIAFYLPQFHPFKENDEWWGKGFTEWTNVTKAVPQFKNHYQPKLPDDFGFYDLRLTSEIMKEQVRVAKNYGIRAFCFHHYWFDGHRLMEKPVDNFLNDKSIDIEFCLCWANENWTRRWDGAENDILMAQNHSPDDDLAFIADVARYMHDERYIRINGKPLLIVYRVTLLPNPNETVKRWRKYCLDSGIGEIHLVAAQSFGITEPTKYGFDAAVEFPPHGLKNVGEKTINYRLFNPDFSGKIFDYKDVVNSSKLYVNEPYELY
ncbi:MAG: glycoside hydrolase family 99-like domain-containing protein, partial [Turicibacter sp.]